MLHGQVDPIHCRTLSHGKFPRKQVTKMSLEMQSLREIQMSWDVCLDGVDVSLELAGSTSVTVMEGKLVKART